MNDLPGPLYHYTSIEAFLNIVQSKSFYASDIYYMNDATEISYAVGLAESIIGAGTADGILPPEFSASLKQALYNTQLAKVFGISFSLERDALSQWRGYGGGAGLALCFNPEKAMKLAAANGLALVKCEYDQSRQVSLIKDTLRSVVAAIKSSPRPLASEVIERECLLQLCPVLSKIKHPAFRDENEWRMLSKVYEDAYEGTHPEKCGYRAGKSVIIPYMKVELEVDYGPDTDQRKDLGFHDVLLGPTQTKELSWKSVMNFLQSNNVKYSQITPSGAPYRASV
jgi:hypothetical protein